MRLMLATRHLSFWCRLRANRSAQNQQVKPVASGFRVRCVLGMSYGTAETFFAAEELLLSESAHRGVGVAERVHLAEEVREADRPRLTNLLKSVLVESRARERLARILDRRVGIDRPSGLGNHRTSSTLSNLPGKPCR